MLIHSNFQVCQATIEDEQEFNNHLQTHTGIHTCAICNTVFKKRETIIAHFKWHEEMKNMSKLEGAHVCEICGLILKSAEHLNEHNEQKHVKKYTCYYCGKMYKGEISFELHIKKHEMNNDIKLVSLLLVNFLSFLTVCINVLFYLIIIMCNH